MPLSTSEYNTYVFSGMPLSTSQGFFYLIKFTYMLVPIYKKGMHYEDFNLILLWGLAEKKTTHEVTAAKT